MKFKGSLALEDKKESHRIQWMPRRPSKPPKKVWIPLQQTESIQALPCVSVGARVCAGEKIANPLNDQSVALHASLSGTVTQVGEFLHPFLGEVQTVEIESDEEGSVFSGVGEERLNWQNLLPEELGFLFQESGLIELRYPTQAVHQKVSQARQKKIKTLVINACETEPYVSCDYSLMMSHPLETLKGIEILRHATEAQKVIIVVGEKEREGAELMKSKIFFQKWNHYEVELVSSLYPQSEDAMITKTLVDGNKLENKSTATIFNLATAFSVYEAIVLQKPLYERIVTLAGECLFETGNLYLPVGCSLAYAIKASKGFLREPRKVLLGGPMKGIAQLNLEVPLLIWAQAVLALPKEVVRPEEVYACTRCGDCNDACPVEISPMMITLAAEVDRFDIAKDYGASHCIECGNCAYVCPSKRPMVELINYSRFSANASSV